MAIYNPHKQIGLLVLFTMMLGSWQLVSTAKAVERPLRKTISYQGKNDLFYNYYEGPNPNGVTAGMYVSPLPVPPHVGHTYFTYQPLMPHEYLYRHTRTHYSYQPCAGWTRAKVRYRTYGLRLDNWLFHLNPCCY
jgi:hypothetical protein